MKLSLRDRLTLWYTAILALTMGFFGYLNYETVSQDLEQNLEQSILKVAESLEYYILQRLQETKQPLRPAQSLQAIVSKPEKKKDENDKGQFDFLSQKPLRDFEGPVLSPKDSTKTESDQPGLVWSAVYEHILLNHESYYIQVADTNNTIVWRSENLAGDTLPLPANLLPEADSVANHTVLSRFELGNKRLRILLYRASLVQITVAYPVEEIAATLNDLFSSLLIAIPGVLLISTLGGWFLAKYSLQPIEDISRSAKEITASNLSLRLPQPAVNDEIAHLTETLNDMISRLEASFEQIRQFTGDASHELRTPLAILMGELEMALRSRKTPEEYESILISAQEEVLRLGKVVENLFQLSRTDSGQIQLDVTPINLGHLLEDIYEDALILAEERGIEVNYASTAETTINGDKVRLHQALLNIVDNAIKYTPEGGTVTISLSANEEQAHIAVRDTGIGIPAEDLKKVFNRFYRVDKARSQNVRGHGLGLAIVRWVVLAHSGTIEIDSEEGRGTLFTICLPFENGLRIGRYKGLLEDEGADDGGQQEEA